MTAEPRPDHVALWDQNYERGRANRYPFEGVVGTILRRFAGRDPASVEILDLGCGGGNHLLFLRNEGFSYWGVDGAPAAIELSKRLLGGDPQGRIRAADFRDLPFPDGMFDAVIDRQSLGHNRWSDIRAIVREIHRVLKPGGLYYGHVFGTGCSDLALGVPQGHNDYADFRGGLFRYSHVVHAFTLEELRELFADFELKRLVHQRMDDLVGGRDVVESFELEADARS